MLSSSPTFSMMPVRMQNPASLVVLVGLLCPTDVGQSEDRRAPDPFATTYVASDKEPMQDPNRACGMDQRVDRVDQPSATAAVARCSLANANDSARSTSRCSSDTRRVLTSTTTDPENSRAARVSSSSAHG